MSFHVSFLWILLIFSSSFGQQALSSHLMAIKINFQVRPMMFPQLFTSAPTTKDGPYDMAVPHEQHHHQRHNH